MFVIWALEVSSHGLQVVTSRKVVSGTLTLRVLCAQQTTIAPSTTISTHCALLSIRTTTLFPELSVGACCEVVQVHSLSVSGETLVQFLSIVKSVQRFEPIAWLTLFAPRPSGRESGHVHSPFNVGASVSVSSSSVVVSECCRPVWCVVKGPDPFVWDPALSSAFVAFLGVCEQLYVVQCGVDWCTSVGPH